MPPWGWIEWLFVTQTLLPALLFIPGLSAVRTPTRVSAYAMTLLAWGALFASGRSSPAARSFPARPWLAFCVGWLVLSIGHPNMYSLATALGQVVLYVSVLSPAFWAGEVIGSPKQLTRIMAVLFACNALSATVGLAQVYSERFYPPVIPVASNKFEGEDLKITLADGRRIFRPCGLTDSPGAAAPAGATAALIGLCFALRPGNMLLRAASAGLALVGVAVIYYTQVRSTLIVLGLSVGVITAMLAYRGRVGSAVALAAGGAAAGAGAFVWAARRMGGQVAERFGSVMTSDFGSVYMQSRGGYVAETFTRHIWENPLGHGLGWWGMIYSLFQDPNRLSLVWVEVQLTGWVFDGGIPLLVGYSGAVAVAVANTLRIALRSRDPDVAFWGSVVLATDLSTVALCFSYVPFLSPIGIQFWVLNAALHAADLLAKGRDVAPARRTGPRPAPTGYVA